MKEVNEFYQNKIFIFLYKDLYKYAKFFDSIAEWNGLITTRDRLSKDERYLYRMIFTTKIKSETTHTEFRTLEECVEYANRSHVRKSIVILNNKSNIPGLVQHNYQIF